MKICSKFSQVQACARCDLSCKSFLCFLLRITTSIRMAILHKFRLPSKWEANLRLSKPMFERERTWPHLSVQVFAYVNIAAKRSMLPNFKTKSTDNQYRMYIQEKHKKLWFNVSKGEDKWKTSESLCTLRSPVPTCRMIRISIAKSYRTQNMRIIWHIVNMRESLHSLRSLVYAIRFPLRKVIAAQICAYLNTRKGF